MITIADEIESFFHVLIYYSVRFLHHNLPDKSVGLFLNSYFNAASGLTQTGELTAPALKHESMKTGAISLEFCSIPSSLQFEWVNEPAQSSTVPTGGPPPDYNHPLNVLIDTLLSWFRGLYTLYRLNMVVVRDPSRNHVGGKVPLLDFEDDGSGDYKPFSKPPPKSAAKDWEELAANLDNHSAILTLFWQACRQTFPCDKGHDKHPEKGYTPCSPETPQFSEMSGFSNFSAESEYRLEEAGAAAPDGPSPKAFAELGAAAGGERGKCRASTVATDARGDELEHSDGPPRTPSPFPSRPKRGREDDTVQDAAEPRTFGKRSWY